MLLVTAVNCRTEDYWLKDCLGQGLENSPCLHSRHTPAEMVPDLSEEVVEGEGWAPHSIYHGPDMGNHLCS